MEKLKIVADRKIPFLQGALDRYAEVVYLDANDIMAHTVADADALIVRTRTACNAALLQNSKVKFIATATIGSDHIDADFCKKNNIVWNSAPGCNASAVQQYVATALLAIAHKKNITLQGKTIGIIGAGNVGKLVAQFAERMRMRILLCDPPRAATEGGSTFASLNEIAAQSDIITLHVPLTYDGMHATYHLADKEFFEKLVRNPLFINTSRGEVVDETYLRQALLQSKISAAVLDVWENEPFINETTLSMVDIGTPHVAGYSMEGKAKAAAMAVQSLARYFNLPLQDWYPPTLPVVAAIPLKYDNMSHQQKLHQIYRSFYDILADDAALRSAPLCGERLRNNYVFRREPVIEET